MAPPSPRTTTARAHIVAVGELTGASPSRRPRHGGAKHRKTEGGEAPKPVQDKYLRKCWQCSRQCHWRRMHNTLAVDVQTNAAKFNWGRAAEILDLRNGFQHEEWVHQC